MTAPIGHKLLCSNFATAAPFYLKNYKAVNKVLLMSFRNNLF